MKFKVLILTILAIAVLLIPTAAFAATEFWQGTAAVTVTDPVSITNTGGDGTYDAVTHAWAVSITGGGTKILKMTATNGSTAAYTVNAIVSPASSPDGLVTAVWSPSAKYIAGGGSQEYTLTVTSAAGAPVGSYNFNLAFSK